MGHFGRGPIRAAWLMLIFPSLFLCYLGQGALVLGSPASTRLAAAYGLAVSGTMLITSVVFFVVTRYAWRWPLWKAAGVMALFLAVDVPFVAANALKFIDGGYLPFFVGVVFVVVMVVWRIGRGLVADYFARTSEPTAQ